MNLSFVSAQSGKYKKKLHKAENYFDHGDYYNALVIFEELLKSDTTSAYIHYHLGVCKFNIRRLRSEALAHLEKSNDKVNPEIYFYLGRLYHLNEDFDKALTNFNKYRNLEMRDHEDAYVDQLIANITTAKKLLAEPVTVEISNLGEIINTAFPEYVPLISADGNKLFFTSRKAGSTGGLKDAYGDYYEDIYYSEYIDGQWSKPVQMSEPVNSATHDACVGLTPEGENLLIFRTNAALTGGDIYLTESDGTNWTNPVLLDPVINNIEWNEPSACYSPDGEHIYFSSNRPGGFGGKDIYRSVKLPNGKWSLAMNLGAKINSPFDEDAPFVHSNGKEFYFSSKGHTNMGGYDIFKADMDSTGNWTNTKNIGYPINTVDDDIYFVLEADGQTGYFSSNHPDGYGETDIYSLHFTAIEPGYIVKSGVVTDLENAPLSAKITLIETDMRKVSGVYKSSRLTGKFVYLKNDMYHYEIVVEAEGYYSKTMHLTEENADSLTIQLTKIKE
jgi:tetratricopeptide (TPR) repeat protein